MRAWAAPDPVGLHGDHALRPGDRLEVQQFVRVLGDTEEPLRQVFFDHGRVAALAVTIITPDLFAGQGGVAVRAEVHRRFLAIGQPVLVKLQEEPLVPLVVGRVAGDGFPFHIEHGAHTAQLPAHVVDVLVSPRLGVDLAFDGRVFSWQPEGVKPDREQHVVALHLHIAGACVGRGHGVPVPDVQVAGGVRQHGHGVVFSLRRIDHLPVQPVGLPPGLPPGFNRLRIVLVRHQIGFLLKKLVRVYQFWRVSLDKDRAKHRAYYRSPRVVGEKAVHALPHVHG